jgi:transposase-like protein
MEQSLALPAGLLSELRMARFPDGPTCPRCFAPRVHRWGTFAGRQRYRCQRCGRTFSDLTGTPAAYLKRVGLLREYAQCFEAGLSIRRISRKLGIHPSTAFRWRHRLCAAIEQHHRDRLVGVVELAVRRSVRSRKGERGLDRPPRRQRYDRALIWPDKVCIVVGCDRAGQVVTGVVDHSHLHPSDIDQIVGPRIGAVAVVVAAYDPFGAIAAFARDRSWRFHDARHPDRQWGIHDPIAAGSFMRRFKRWLARFRGVATKYLPNYLAWRRALDRAERARVAEAALRWPNRVYGPPQFPRTEAIGGGERPTGDGSKEADRANRPGRTAPIAASFVA